MGLRSCGLQRQVVCILGLLVVWMGAGVNTCAGQLSNDFYGASCPNVVSIVRRVIAHNLVRDITAPAALLRLLFHDCQVQGCDGSILLDSQDGIVSEREAASNLGIRRLDFIDKIKEAIEEECPNTVSCADIIVLAARESVKIAGGPHIEGVILGRRDSTNASDSTASSDLPPADARFNSFLQIFASKGMSLEESVAILGAHTLGVGHCGSVVNRLYPQRDRSLGPLFYNVLRLRCPPRYGKRVVVLNDLTTLTFDTQYFEHALGGRGLFRVDSDVASNPLTRPIMQRFKRNPRAFFTTFSSAFLKLSLTNVLTGSQGEIRQNCHFVNSLPLPSN
eukprot:c18995_g1_i1 orf=480-1484(-)